MAKFKTGDIVEITNESAFTGMLDFREGMGYEVEGAVFNGLEWHIKLTNDSDRTQWICAGHFKIKENSVESNENHFKVGQIVWDVVYGKGVVYCVNKYPQSIYPIKVKFEDGNREYTKDGKQDKEFGRTLFFSEPKIIAETKPSFVPKLKVGTPIILTQFAATSQMIPAWVKEEKEDIVVVSTTDLLSREFCKKRWKIYSVGEKIEFN